MLLSCHFSYSILFCFFLGVFYVCVRGVVVGEWGRHMCINVGHSWYTDAVIESSILRNPDNNLIYLRSGKGIFLE